jgi:glycosyltransferase involved in cell wall biosynthesis
MNLQNSFDYRISFTTDTLIDVLSDTKTYESYPDPICFVKGNYILNRNIENILRIDIPKNWILLVADVKPNHKSKKTDYFKIDIIKEEPFGFFIKKNMINTLINQLKADSPPCPQVAGCAFALLGALNNFIKNKICYGFCKPIIHQADINNTISYYDYYFHNNIFNETVNYFKDWFKTNSKISIRHQLRGLPKFISPDELIRVFDYKLGCDPKYVNELISLSMYDVSVYSSIENHFELYSKKKLISKLKFINKDLINLFFDKYIYCEPAICVIIPSFNNADYYQKNINSVINQKYSNWRIIYVDDQSPDQTYQLVKKFVTENNLWEKFELFQQVSHGAQCCGRFMAYMNTDDDEIAINLDGDDWLYDREDQDQYNAFQYVSSTYNKGWWSSYGCFYKSSGPQWMETRVLYPKEVIDNKTYRSYKYLCKHLRTGYAGLYKNIDIADLMGPDHKFLHMCTDLSTQYPVIEMAGNKHGNVLMPTYIYNQDNSVAYNNSFYNLEKKDNEANKNYYDFVTKKIINRKPYDTVKTFKLDAYYDFNRFTEILEIVIIEPKLNLPLVDKVSANQSDITYFKSKIEHEINKSIKYVLTIIPDISEYKPINSSLVLLINSSSDNIIVNFRIDKYLKWMLSTKINYILIDNRIDTINATPITENKLDYIVYLDKNLSSDFNSGFYTRSKFNALLNKDSLGEYRLIMKSTDKITYMVALYNIPINWVKEAIESVKLQTDDQYCLLVCDDGTPNLNYQRDTFKYLFNEQNTFFRSKLRICQSQKNNGLSGNNRTMIGLAESTIIACFDPDDTIMPETTEELLKAYQSDSPEGIERLGKVSRSPEGIERLGKVSRSPEGIERLGKVSRSPDFVYSNFYYCDVDLNIKSKGFSRNILPNKLIIYENCVSNIKTYKRSSYHKTLGYDITFKSAEDKDLILKFEESGAKFKFIPKELYKYRFNPKSLSKEGTNAFNNQKTLQYCKTAITDSYYRRILNGSKQSPVSLNNLWARYGMKDIPETVYEKYFHDWFDQIYVINLQKNESSLNKMKLKLNRITAKKVKICRFKLAKDLDYLQDLFNTVKKQPITTSLEKRENKKIIASIGEIGCSESHLYCLKDAHKNGYKKIMILEDDVYFDKQFLIKFKEYTENIPDVWQFMMLGASQWSWWGNSPFINKNYYYPTRASSGTFAIGIDLNSIPNVINSISRYDGPSDLGGYQNAFIPLKPTEHLHSIAYLYENRSPIDKCFVLYPNLIIADTRSSDIRQGNSETDHLIRCKNMDWKIKNKCIDDYIVTNEHVSDINYQVINVDDYDDIYPNIEGNSDETIILASENLPFQIHQILLKSRNNKIIVMNTTPDFTYYQERMKRFVNIRFNQSNFT